MSSLGMHPPAAHATPRNNGPRESYAVHSDAVNKILQATNVAQNGRSIADTEELVRQANGAFREQLYEKAIRLSQSHQEAFSPSARGLRNKGPRQTDASDGQQASVCA